MDEGSNLEESVPVVRLSKEGPVLLPDSFRLRDVLPVLRHTKENPQRGCYLYKTYHAQRPKLIEWLQGIGLVPGRERCRQVWAVRAFLRASFRFF